MCSSSCSSTFWSTMTTLHWAILGWVASLFLEDLWQGQSVPPIDNHPPSGLGKQIRFSWVDFLEANILYLICITTIIIHFSLLDLKRDPNSVVCCVKYSCPSYELCTFSTKCHRLVSRMNTEILLHIWKVQVLGFSYFLSKMLYSWPLRLSDPSFGYGLLMATRYSHPLYFSQGVYSNGK